ncbi:universal stress protein UspE [Cognaticolwellia aestuarii]|mgnify:FL=1|jgi:universal stress protein E|uniref:universal stress protein UspE n=1 Tax=Cognaticolwellia aestuarii TaxID=329993 RepID=UPI00079C56CD|nr:universal stress protein UspE [Cognaticolwellia aestuarii]KXJ59229.1 MAG: universal stress protein UspE [Colwellia sp. Phe_37]|tara:strand:+ start:18391 stop:19323 length:933 start_codon:yes stop_codon:yes gene_type:complete
MEKYQKILAVVDPTTEDQKALKRAIELARKTGASITAFLTIYDFSYEMTTMLSSDEREAMRQSVINDRTQWLQSLLSELDTGEIRIDCQVIWHNRPFEQIIEQVLKNGYDIVIKGTHQHDKLKSVIFTPTDWHILRKCPCPVLLVKEHLWPDNGNIVAALNIGSDEEEHNSLNEKITAEAKQLTKVMNANLHLVNSYPGTPVNIAIEIPEFNASDYNRSMFKHHENAMQEHAQAFNIAKENTHIKEGLPEDVIQSIANELDAELVILGTVGRTGLSAALIGNTAEHVIDRLNCDVLALKPDGYVSPLDVE